MSDQKKQNDIIKSLFTSNKNIRIPAYQRAFSWEVKQCTQFIEDLIEQKGKRYYLGQFLFEEEGDTLYIIDGQQRLTTTIIFISAIIKIKNDRGEKTSDVSDIYLTDIFKTIEDDQLIFKKITQKHLISLIDDTETISQKRIIDAFNFFESKLSSMESKIIDLILQTLESAVISTFYITNKVEATQVFEYQNNRGKELSKFEVIKAYLMHQVYLKSKDTIQANNIITDIQGIISKTYRYIESVEGFFSETELLNNCCDLFYNINGNINDIKEILGNISDKTQWIKSFFENFAEICHSAKSIVSNKNKLLIMNLFFVGNDINWKIVLLTVFHKGQSEGKLFDNILILLEILSFKFKLGDFRTDYLMNYSKRYFKETSGYNLQNLFDDIYKACISGFKWYWNNNNSFSSIINNYFKNEKYHYHRNIIKYVLWQYENNLRSNFKSGALLDKDLYNIYTIEHISPQNPSDTTYTDDFKNNYLNLAGNLALLTQNQNSKFSNKTFEIKKELFQDTALSSYTEIRSCDTWGEAEILSRHKKICDFVDYYFDFNKREIK